MLEPSFGACGFLVSSSQTLERLGAPAPLSLLYGCELDADASECYLSSALGVQGTNGNFLTRDFMTVSPEDFGHGGFDVVLGNPPYVSHHNMTSAQHGAAVAALAGRNLRLDGKSSLWAYFVVHALSFLRPGGRCAWVLPRSVLYSDYSVQVRSLLTSGFRHCTIVEVQEQLFRDEGASDGMMVLVAEGYGFPSEGTMAYAVVRDVASLQAYLDTRVGRASSDSKANPRSLCGPSGPLFEEIRDSGTTFQLGELAKIQIGTVTGANSLFLLRKSAAERWKLSGGLLCPALAKSRLATGLVFSETDFARCLEDDQLAYILDTSGGQHELSQRGSPLRKYLAQVPRGLRRRSRTFRKRQPWHAVRMVQTPDAFLMYMSSRGPRLVINSCAAIPTNSVHAVTFNPEIDTQMKAAVAIGLMSSFAQLSAELTGRSLAGGLLKHEVGEARRIAVPIPPSPEGASKVLKKVDRLVRKSDWIGVHDAADAFALGRLGAKAHKVLRSELRSLRARRRRLIGQEERSD